MKVPVAVSNGQIGVQQNLVVRLDIPVASAGLKNAPFDKSLYAPEVSTLYFKISVLFPSMPFKSKQLCCPMVNNIVLLVKLVDITGLNLGGQTITSSCSSRLTSPIFTPPLYSSHKIEIT